MNLTIYTIIDKKKSSHKANNSHLDVRMWSNRMSHGTSILESKEKKIRTYNAEFLEQDYVEHLDKKDTSIYS